MDKKTWIIIGVLVVLFGGLVGVSLIQSNAEKSNAPDNTTLIAASEASGNIPEMVIGDPDAPVKIIEYGDYQCTACAPMSPYINELVEEYDGKLAVIFRTVIMSYHQNGTAAASAALAAYKQGYWKEYKDILFKNQNDWYYSDATERQKQFEEYLMKVSDNKADLEKFREDMAGQDIAQKLAFDEKIADQVNVEWTPYFMIDGELVSQKDISRDQFLDNLRAKIDAKLKTLE